MSGNNPKRFVSIIDELGRCLVVDKYAIDAALPSFMRCHDLRNANHEARRLNELHESGAQVNFPIW